MCIYTQYIVVYVYAIDKYSCCIIKDQRTEWGKKIARIPPEKEKARKLPRKLKFKFLKI